MPNFDDLHLLHPFSESKGTKNLIQESLQGASNKIMIMTYSCSPSLLEKMLPIVENGLPIIRVIVDQTALDGLKKYTKKMSLNKKIQIKALKAEIRTSTEEFKGVMHTKAIIIDDEKMISGSINFTHAALANNFEMARFECHRDTISRVSTYFEYLWEDTTLTEAIPNYNFISIQKKRLMKEKEKASSDKDQESLSEPSLKNQETDSSGSVDEPNPISTQKSSMPK